MVWCPRFRVQWRLKVLQGIWKLQRPQGRAGFVRFRGFESFVAEARNSTGPWAH